MKHVNDLLPSHVRKWAYVIFALAGVGFGATQTAFVTAEQTAPLWLTVAFQVYLYVGGAFGLVAATNTSETLPDGFHGVLGTEVAPEPLEVSTEFEETGPKHAL